MKVAAQRALRVGINALSIGEWNGGIFQFLIGLAMGLSTLTDGDEEYLFLAHPDSARSLRPYVSGPCQILPGPPPPRTTKLKQRIAAVFPSLRSAWDKLMPLVWRGAIGVPRSDGTIERARIEVMHFPFQSAFLTDVPSIYHPWDLQHLHLPQFFTPRVRALREVMYRAFCEKAQMVSVATTWAKRDLIHHLKLPPEKVVVVPAASLLYTYPQPGPADLASVRKKLMLPETFAFYPAHTWPHKNHLGLLEALAILRDRQDLRIHFVFSGTLNEFFPQIQRQMQKLRLADQVQFLGFVTPLELHCLYKLCRCMVFPSKFEGFGFPVTEAFQAGVPVACSRATSLPDLAGDAALYFDPDDPQEMAEAIRRLWTQEQLRITLAEQGRKNASRFSWDTTARIFRAHYRRLAHRPLTEEDRALIGSPPLL